MRYEPAPSPAPDGDDDRRAPERSRTFSRRIECDGEGYAAAVRGAARGGGMREPRSRQERRETPRR
jgi:hypothetical protein